MTPEPFSSSPCKYGCGKKLHWRYDVPFEDENFIQVHRCINKPRLRSVEERITRIERILRIEDGGYW